MQGRQLLLVARGRTTTLSITLPSRLYFYNSCMSDGHDSGDAYPPIGLQGPMEGYTVRTAVVPRFPGSRLVDRCTYSTLCAS